VEFSAIMSPAKNQDEPQSALSQWRQRLRALGNIGPILRMVWESSPKVVAGSLFLRFLVALIPVTMLAITKVIIDSIYAYTSHHQALPGMFWWLVALEFGLASLATILNRLIELTDSVIADKYTHFVSTRIMAHAASLDLTSYEDPVFYDKLERARVQGTDRIGMIQSAGRLVQQVTTTASLAASIYLVSPWILLVLVACLVPAFVGETHFAFLTYSLNFRQTRARREMDYLRIIGGSKESAKELKLFGLAPFFVNRFSTLSHNLHGENISLATRRFFFGAVLTLLGTCGYYGTYAYAIYLTVIGALTLGTLTFLAGAIAGTSSNVQAVFSSFSSIADQALFLGDLLEFLSVRPKVFSKPGALPAPRRIQSGIEFRNVSFFYPSTSRPVLHDINFSLQPAERVALVGENGQGKTTIVKLILRLYDVTSGQILLDGIDLREYDLDSLWKMVGVIFQDFMRYEMTASENIAVGGIEDRTNPFRIRAAAQKSLAEDLIRKLPAHYEQILGRRFEGGVDLSGGEWQKIALARAYMRDAQLLILDEPTAALDARAERGVYQRFADLTDGKMSLLISHRFSTVRMADRIFVLDSGKIIEQGSHHQLLSCGGRYAELYELQAAHYR
jgi:ATP-binding cassette, subfamily B, bacterial